MDESTSAASARPDLSIFGIDEFERGVCEDIAINRNILRKSKMEWQVIFDDEGRPTNRIEVMSAEMREHRAQTAADDRKMILENMKNPNSDYLSGAALILEPDVENIVPSWVLSATRDWLETERRREDAGDPTIRPALLHAPGRCVARKNDGGRCMHWNSGKDTSDMCRQHRGVQLQKPMAGAIVERVRSKLLETGLAAADQLENLMNNAESEPVRLKATTEIMDRIGVRGGMEIDQNVNIDMKPAAEIIADRMEKLKLNIMQHEANVRANQLELEGEIVEDETDAD
jgi:hypothetical protein